MPVSYESPDDILIFKPAQRNSGLNGFFDFMQDSAPSHRAKATHNFLRDNMPDFICTQEWTPHLPDLNPLDYSVCDILQVLVYEGRHEPFANLKDIQNVIRDKWHDVDDHTVRKAIL